MPAQVIPEKAINNHGIHPLGRENNIPPYRRLEGKVAIITGGARGIGEAAARLFVRHGARVVIADVDAKLGELVAESLGPAASFVRCDVSCEDDVARLVDSAVARHGRLDVLLNNAGVLGDRSHRRKSVLDLDAQEFDRVMAVNVKGAALGIKHAARAMLGGGGGGCIISTASVAGVMGGLGPHAYTASKHAIVGLTKNAACELGRHGIRVNCISPFGVATPMLVNAWRSTLGFGEEGEGLTCEEEDEAAVVERTEEFVRGLANLKGPTLQAKDVAEAALYLASDEAKYVSGHNLVVDGGVTTSRNCIGL